MDALTMTKLLTPRETEILGWAARGRTAGEIGAILGITKRTVEAHLASAAAKLGALNRVHAVAMAMKLQIISF
jgi:LuxR family transcriptional regulator, quorum-sensing system regulator BjaR1